MRLYQHPILPVGYGFERRDFSFDGIFNRKFPSVEDKLWTSLQVPVGFRWNVITPEYLNVCYVVMLPFMEKWGQ